MNQEIELKFEVDPGAAKRLEQKLIVRRGKGAVGPPQVLTSVYFDTPGRALRRAGLTLRVREAGGKHVQTVKSEAEGLFARGEWETGLKGPDIDLDAVADSPLSALIEDFDGPLAPVFITRVERTKRLVRLGKAQVEAALDRGEVQADGRTAPLCELELELKAGDPGALYQLARQLADAAPLRLSFITKSERGYRLLDGAGVGEAVKQGRVRLKRGMTVRDAFAAVAGSALRQWVANAAVLAAARRPEALHQMRVALRRLRTAMTLFESIVADPAYSPLNAELAWLAGELDQGRDIDVLIAETFRPAAERLAGQTGLAGLGERLLEARTRAYDRTLGVLDSPRYLTLVLDTAAWVESGAWADAADPLQGPRIAQPVEHLAREGLDRLRRQIRKRGEALDRLDPRSRHKLRIRAKRLRYAIEFFQGLYGHKPARDAFLDNLKVLQDSLGALNDVTVARDKGLALAEGGGRAAGDSEAEGVQQAFAAGLMIGLRENAEAALLTRAQKACDALIGAKRFWR